MRFSLVDLRLFLSVAELRNITHGAEACNLSLGAASNRIRSLEDQAGVSFFNREARGVRLTPAGESFLHYAKKFLRDTENLQIELTEYNQNLRGYVRVYANTTAVIDMLPRILPTFLKANPNVNVSVQEKSTEEISQGVLDGRADFGIAAGDIDTVGLRTVHFTTDRLVLAVPCEHHLATYKKIAFAETLGEDYVGMHNTSNLQRYIGRISTAMGATLRIRAHMSSFSSMCSMIGIGIGVGILPESTAKRYVESERIVLVELEDDWKVRKRYMLMNDFSSLPTYAELLVDELFNYYRRQEK
jgi:DNA-binding transcriptional LysR family regulator